LRLRDNTDDVKERIEAAEADRLRVTLALDIAPSLVGFGVIGTVGRIDDDETGILAIEAGPSSSTAATATILPFLFEVVRNLDPVFSCSEIRDKDVFKIFFGRVS